MEYDILPLVLLGINYNKKLEYLGILSLVETYFVKAVGQNGDQTDLLIYDLRILFKKTFNHLFWDKPHFCLIRFQLCPFTTSIWSCS